MRLSGFGWVHSMNIPLRLCLCLVLVGLITTGAIGCTAGSSAKGKLPNIKLFAADPLVLNDGDSALYTFVVKGAENIQVIEAGNTIKEINSPSSATLKGTVKGLPTSAIRTDSPTFDTVLIAKNGSGEVEKKLTLRFATELPPKPAPPPAGPLQRSPQWGEQSSSSLPLTQPTPSTTTQSRPEFAKCPSGCNYCLKPDEAANLGFTQRCSEQLCYYSPDNQQKWYCYKPAPGWCCKDGKVNQSTKDQCAQMGGAYWSTNQNEALQACQPIGWCCRDGNLYQATQAQCAQVGGAYWSTNQNEAMRACQPIGWCCRDGNLYQATQAQCAQVGGSYWSTNQAEAMRACQPVLCWCCSGGKVYQTTQAQCAQTGGTCYATQSQATAGCRLTTPTYR